MALAFSNWWEQIRLIAWIFTLLTFGTCPSPKKDSFFKSSVPFPPHNPPTKEGIDLGKALFSEKGLSGSGDISCSTCHPPEQVFTRADFPTKRAIPSLYNLAWAPRLFWDGSQQNLESLIFRPIADTSEMGGHILVSADSLGKIQKWKRLFQIAFGKDTIYPALISRALSQYIRSLVWPLPVEKDLKSLEKRGQVLFQNHCESCHKGQQSSDFQWRKSVLAATGADKGKYHLTRDTNDYYFFKTPGLARISETAPYMHNHSIPDLESIVEKYGITLKIQNLSIPENRIALLAYLKKL